MKHAWIQDHRDQFPVAVMCRILRVSRSGWYDAQQRAPSQRVARSQRIREQVKQLYDQSDSIYGSYKIADRMKNDKDLETACRNTVAKAMQEMGLKSKVSKKFKPKTTQVDPTKKPAANLLDQVFTAEAPDR